MYAPAKPRAKRAKIFFEIIFSVCGGGGVENRLWEGG